MADWLRGFLVPDKLLFDLLPAMGILAGGLLCYSRTAAADIRKAILTVIALLIFGVVRQCGEYMPGYDSFTQFSIDFWMFVGLLIVYRQSPCAIVFCSGAIMNALAALLNGGKMPVLDFDMIEFLHQPMTPATRLWWLGDWIQSFPSGYIMMSIGDLLFLAGSMMFMTHELELWRQKSAGKIPLR